ncbi:6948_t:CDS:2 [Ambispora leptoticha]|uniref:6948_t:CDS:1 n=1 Tax=Ambispora leptoticha TaxID=144679 RepID=A0A9N8V440_9GLOM|nr:6948_t:CDS:2 [Ambispora leptoticha]
MTIIKYPEPPSWNENISSKDFHIIGKMSANPTLPAQKLPKIHQPERLDIAASKKNATISISKGNKLTKEQIRRNIKRKAKQAGIKKNISPHSFRRSLATNLYNLGGKLETIQKQLGHASLDTTLGYIHNDYQTFIMVKAKQKETFTVKPIHPGTILREELLIPRNISPNELAIALKVPKEQIK